MEFNGAIGTARPPVIEQGYRAARLLGSGSTARVWLAVREHDGACFALKTPAAGGGPAGTFETRRELNILSRFEHENLLHLYTVLETDQGPGLLMEHAPGESLSRLAAVRGTLTPGESVTVLVGIGSALAYLHGQGIVHGDVSPGNILFSAQGKPLLADLGTARLLGTAGPGVPPAPHAVDAAAEPVAPERLPQPDADVFALAASGWLILTGQALPPQAHRPRLEALVPGIPPALAAAVEAGLRADAPRPDAAEFTRLVFASAAAEPLDLALPVNGDDGPGAESRRARIELGRASAGLRARGRRRTSGRRAGPDERITERRRPNRLLLSAAAVLVAGTMGLGAVAVAAPEMLQPQGNPAPEGQTPEGPAPEGLTLESQTPEGSAPAGPGAAAPEQGDAPQADASAVPAPPAGTAQAVAPRPEAAPGPGPLALVPEPELQALLRADDPVRAAAALAELRARAFSTADAGRLDGVNLPGSSAMEADRAEVAKLEAAGTVLSGLAVEVLSAGPALPGEGGRFSVPAAVSTSAYAERDAHGGMVRGAEALSRQDIVLVMVNTPDGWRIEDILASPA